jgi:putative ABC transport system permease protein
MEKLFGIPMDTIMLVLVALFAISLASVALIFLTNRMMFRMGLRNLPRRGLHTGLVVVGLMLATLITTAAFTTGDTVDYSIARTGYETLQRSDLSLNLLGEDSVVIDDVAVYFDEDVTGVLEQRFVGDPDIEGFIPLLIERVPAIDQRTQQSEPSITITGIDPQRLAPLGGLRLVDGGRADLAALGPNEILLTGKAAGKLSAKEGDRITLYANGSSVDVVVAGIVQDELASSGNAQFFADRTGGGAMLLSIVQQLTGHPGEINSLTVALKGDVATSYTRSDSAISRLEPFLQSDEGRQLLGVNQPVSVEPVKADTIEEAELNGNLFTTFFLILGLFSIAAGVMLIFMIFVMLATERKAEMGMARAVGAQRSSLVQAFISEGMAYSVLAGALGAALGVAVALALVVGFLKISGGYDFIHAHVTLRSLVISYCLGVVLTFLTVVISSLKVSSVNIVAAIRDIDDDERYEEKRKISWRWLIAGIPAMIVPPLGIWFFFRKGLGLAWAWIIAPITLVLGLFAIVSADSADSEFLFSFGVSVLPLAVAMLASHYRAPGRLTWTLVGAYLALYWLAPVDYGKLVYGRSLAADIEMFLLSGVMVVVSFTLIIVFNARVMTAFFQRGNGNQYKLTAILTALTLASIVGGVALGDRFSGLGQLLYLLGGVIGIGAVLAFASVRFSHLAPALKMGVAYPLSNRFRTGMTIAMFALIVFSLSVFSALNNSFVQLLTADGGDGGWDVMVTANRNSQVPDLETALRSADAPVVEDIASIGRTTVFTGESQVREAGEGYTAYPVIAADDAFFAMPEARLEAWANGYESERAVLDAVKNGTNLAIVDPAALPGSFNGYDFYIDSLDVKDDRFDPIQVQLTNIATGAEETVTVVGVLAIQVDSSYTAGIYVPERTYTPVFGAPDYLRSYVKLEDGVNAKRAAESIEAKLVTRGVQAESIQALLDEAVAQNNSFIRTFQGFMGLGLLTGIAALGVIAFRSVVERRQQIGMLRAIGYQPGTVALTFMFESGFIALMGILSGVIGGMIITRNLFTSGQFSGEGIQFAIPWVEVLLIAGTAFVFSMLMTWLPSRQASQVAVADALRYE